MLSMITLRRFSRLSSSTTSVLSACGQWMNQASHLVVHARPGWLGRQGSMSSTLYKMVTGRLQPSCYSSLLLVPGCHPVSYSRIRSWTQLGQNWRIIHFNACMSWAYVLTTTDFQQDLDVWEGLVIPGFGRLWIEAVFDPQTRGIANGCTRLLIVDAHSSHFTYELLDYARTHDIVVICLPPHTTHALQSKSPCSCSDEYCLNSLTVTQKTDS